jgi:hypothetical protein
MALELPVVEDAPQIGMTGEVNAVLVKGLAFPPVGGAPQMAGGGDAPFRLGHRAAHLDDKVVAPVAQGVDDGKPRRLWLRVVEVVNGGDVEQQAAVERRIVFEPRQGAFELLRLNLDDRRVEHGGTGGVGEGRPYFFQRRPIHINRESL